MKYYLFDEDYEKQKKPVLNKKRLLKVIVLSTTFVLVTILFALYIANAEFRGWTDKYILGKEMTENTGVIIKTDVDLSDANIYAYDRYIAILSKNNLKIYDASGNEAYNIAVTISNPIVSSNGRYFGLAEKGGNKLYLIADGNIMWQKDLENEIAQIYVNENGYISVSHKTMVKLFNQEGKEITTAYLSSTYALDTKVSNDNRELAIAEVNYSGSIVQSNLRIISIEKAQTDKENAVIYSFKAEPKEIVTGMRFQAGNILMYMLDNRIVKRINDSITEEVKFDSDTMFADVNLEDNLLVIKRKQSGLFSSDAQVEIRQISNGKIKIYDSEVVPKSIKTYQNIIALNCGTEAHFISTGGWLVKKYTASRDIKDIVLCTGLAGIIYKDKIELVNL